jgi:hypothetical protein
MGRLLESLWQFSGIQQIRSGMAAPFLLGAAVN